MLYKYNTVQKKGNIRLIYLYFFLYIFTSNYKYYPRDYIFISAISKAGSVIVICLY